MAGPQVPSTALTTEELRTALAGNSVSELQEVGRRVQKSRADLMETLEDLQAEQKLLHEENASLRSTIELMMQELKKLNIGANNTVDPMLDEGPLDFVGRIWERVRPRDSGVVVSEHVGELTRVEDGSPVAGQQLAQVGEKVVGKSREVVQNLRTSLGPMATGLWFRAEQLVNGAGPASAQTRQKQRRDPKKASAKPKKAPAFDRAGYPADGGAAAAAAPASEGAAASSASAPPPAAAAAEPAAPAAAEPVTQPAADSASAPAASDEARPSAAPQQADAGGRAPPAAAAAAAPPASPEPAAEGAGQQASGPEEQMSSTILIEAQLRVDDGSVQTLHVRAADRCKEVARRFVQEHSLKAWFEEPLTVWLKKVEADAVKFPVKIEGDLIEIRKQHSKR